MSSAARNDSCWCFLDTWVNSGQCVDRCQIYYHSPDLPSSGLQEQLRVYLKAAGVYRADGGNVKARNQTQP